MFLFFCGIPVFFLETALGQYTSEGVVTAWRKICPMFEGKNKGSDSSRLAQELAMHVCSCGVIHFYLTRYTCLHTAGLGIRNLTGETDPDVCICICICGVLRFKTAARKVTKSNCVITHCFPQGWGSHR